MGGDEEDQYLPMMVEQEEFLVVFFGVFDGWVQLVLKTEQ